MEKTKIRINYFADNTQPRVIVQYWDSEENKWEDDCMLTKTDFNTREQARNYIEGLKQLDEVEVVNVDVY
ncbi:hypothetical protein EDM57_04965 [Brevibacillus gelatini]|uniref:Uncharacterized protein n=1 Tax=Brevibacillus gelatini TaxID=1655277 RepID=A0A3M8B851_9BACL|nr:hypothetical protein [Brevibacillus gelatini]RNB59493.1 hypothetical protein EDM57_04965 [Brevibacillus gelatini]